MTDTSTDRSEPHSGHGVAYDAETNIWGLALQVVADHNE
jgi:hypothetical protein